MSTTLRRLWIAFASVAGVVLLVVGAATLLRLGRFEWIAHPAPISIWNNQATEIEVTLIGTRGSATYTIAPHGLVTLAVPTSVGEPTSIREGELGGNGCTTDYNDGFGSLREGTLMVIGAVPDGPEHGCGTVTRAVDGLEVVTPNTGS